MSIEFEIYDGDERNSALVDALRIEMPKLTRKQRIAGWFRNRWWRVVTAWRVLRGDDIHEDCY